MAIRSIRTDGDEILRKISKKVEVIDKKVHTLLDDMAETMYKADGVGLAAPQVGILKRIVVIDVGDGLIELINPEIIESSGEQTDMEGCLSIPGIVGEVKRPARVVAKAVNRSGKEFTIEGTELLAVALCHETDHLEGILFKDKAVKLVDLENLPEKE
ncbi:peptide deformylase [Anaerobacterium chartisolvens]|uniref:Peptide deformylase n=1 Tax=Anaerobacterium chartisolvens TaxID=1297424 RepID=A0A369B5I5_9FIRM|nr:peptide deformylase [Anaerobacterium chartisolvens]RCX16779.1 peptide deformylase [Anaerobacterium chartisolvens]